MRIVLVAVILISSAAAAMGQTGCTTSVLVSPYVPTDDRVGLFPRLVPLGDIQAHVAGKPARVSSIRPERKPLRAILVLDASGSMQSFAHESENSNRKWLFVLALSRKIVATAQPGSTFGVLAFSGNDRLSLPTTADAGRLLLALDQMHDYRGQKDAMKTPLWNAIAAASSLLQPRSPQDILIVLSDGEANGNDNAKAVRRSFAQLGVRVFSVLFLKQEMLTAEALQGREDMRALVHQSGGFTVDMNAEQLQRMTLAESEQAVDSAAKILVALATNTYEIRVEREPSNKREKLDLRAKGIQLLYPQFLPPCTGKEQTSSGRPDQTLVP